MTIREHPQPEYLTVEQVSELLKLGESTVRRRIRSVEIPAIRLASHGRGLVRVPRDELEAWLRARRFAPIPKTRTTRSAQSGQKIVTKSNSSTPGSPLSGARQPRALPVERFPHSSHRSIDSDSTKGTRRP